MKLYVKLNVLEVATLQFSKDKSKDSIQFSKGVAAIGVLGMAVWVT